MWPSPDGRKAGLPLSKTWIGREVALAGQRCSPPIHVYPHKLRHFCIAQMFADGYDAPMVQYIAGHSSLATTSIYAKAAPERVRAGLVEGGWGDWL